MKQAVRILFFVLATLSVGHAQELFPLQAVPTPTGGPQWIVSQLYDCVTPYSIGNSFGRGDTSSGICIIPWGVSDTGQPSYTGESLILLIKWNIATAQTITSVRLQNNAATCSPISGASAINNTAGTNLVAYLCPNLVRPANVAMVQWSGPVGNDVEIGVAEVYGCTAPCVTEGGNASSVAFSPSPSSPVSISTSVPTTANNDLIMSFVSPNATISSSTGACCTASFTGGNGFTHGEYQIGATQQTYTNTFTASSGGGGFVDQIIFALKQNPAPPVANVGSIIQQGYSAPDTATVGTIVGNVSAMTTDRSRFLGTLAMPSNPGGLLNFDPVSGALTLARTLTSADDNISSGYAGQLSATENNTTFIQPIAFHVLPPLTTNAGSNCHNTPPPAALRAGLTKLAYCLDGAGAKYAAAQNWIDCNQTNANGFEWYIGGFPTLLCNDVTQGTDPVTGRSSVILHYHSTTDWNTMQSLHPGDSGILDLGMGSQNSCNGPCVPFFYTVPATSYVEWGIRSTPIMNDGVGHSPSPAWWEYGTCPDLTNNNCAYPNSWSIQEFDDMEAYGPCPNCGATTLHDWFDVGSGVQDKTGGSGSTQGIVSNYHNSVPGWNITDYHRYGALRTVDGTSTKRNAMYLDDVIIKNNPIGNGTSNPFDQPVLSTQTTNGLDETTMLSTRQFLVMWFGGTFGLNTTACQTQPACVAAGGDPDQFTYIDHVEVWQAPSDPINGIISGQVTVANGLTQ